MDIIQKFNFNAFLKIFIKYELRSVWLRIVFLIVVFLMIIMKNASVLKVKTAMWFDNQDD